MCKTMNELEKVVADYRGLKALKEQVEEEKNADDLIKKMKLFGSDAKGLYALNQELKARVYTAPTQDE